MFQQNHGKPESIDIGLKAVVSTYLETILIARIGVVS